MHSCNNAVLCLASFTYKIFRFIHAYNRILFTIHTEELFSHSVMSSSLRPYELQRARLPCPLPSPRACSNSSSLSWWCHPTICSSIIPFSCFQSFPASGSFPLSQLFASGSQSIGASASGSVHPVNIQDLGLTGLISLQSKGLSRVFCNNIVQKHQFFGT